jgi:hypothetical protein
VVVFPLGFLGGTCATARAAAEWRFGAARAARLDDRLQPVVDAATGAHLIQAMRWNDPEQLAAAYIADVRECSGGWVNYRIVQRNDVDALPTKIDGFCYTPQEYVNIALTHRGAHEPDAVDYHALLEQFSVLPRVAAGEIDEVVVVRRTVL